MKVCYLINGLSPGGAQTLLFNIVRHTDDPDVDFTVVFIEGQDTLASNFREVGARVEQVEADFKFDPRALLRLGRIFRTETFDIVHTHLPYAQTVGRVAAYLTEQPVIVSTQHNFPSHYHPITRTTERLTRPLDDATIAVSKAVQQAFGAELESQWHTIYNGIDISEFQSSVDRADGAAIREEWEIHPEDHVFLCVGRYAPQKRQSLLIRAFAQADLPNSHLLLVGWGSKEADLRETVHRSDIEDRVTITGRVPEIEPYYASADTFVSASTTESYGIVYLEAMAAGLPIGAAKVQGAEEVLTEASEGIVFIPQSDKDEFAAVFSKLVDEPLEPDYENALQKFDISSTASIHLELYQELIEEKSSYP